MVEMVVGGLHALAVMEQEKSTLAAPVEAKEVLELQTLSVPDAKVKEYPRNLFHPF